jgi:hypothetical protein
LGIVRELRTDTIKYFRVASMLLICVAFCARVYAQQPNTEEFPVKILRSGTNIFTNELSPNAQQLGEQLGLMPLFHEIQASKEKLLAMGDQNPDKLALRVRLLELDEKAHNIIQKTSMEVDFLLAGIQEERRVNGELLDMFRDRNAKTIVTSSAVGFGINGLLWPVSAAFNMANSNVISGIIGIPAGVVPMLTTGYAYLRVKGGRYSAPAQPNILARMFDLPATYDIDYPHSVWTFLNTVPASDSSPSKTRREQILDHWVSDRNIPDLTDKNSKKEMEILAGVVPQKKTLTLSLLNSRQVMFEELSGQILKMNRLLLELMMVLTEDKFSIKKQQNEL